MTKDSTNVGACLLVAKTPRTVECLLIGISAPPSMHESVGIFLALVF